MFWNTSENRETFLQGDNTGGGAPGDATHILRMFVEQRVEGAVVMYLLRRILV